MRRIERTAEQADPHAGAERAEGDWAVPASRSRLPYHGLI